MVDGQAAQLTARSGWRHRVRGSILLAACGDALGVPFEGMTSVDASLVETVISDAGSLRCSDDTMQLMVLAEHLTRRRGDLAEDELAQELVAEWQRDPQRGYAAGAVRLLSQVAEGEPWWEAAAHAFDGAGSFGNGAAMRVAPIGLLPGLGFGSVAALARRGAAVTHTHLLGLDGAVAQAVAVAQAARTTPGEPIEVDRFIAVIGSQVRGSEFRSALRRVAALVRGEATAAQIAQAVGNQVTALDSVPAALTAFLRHPDDPPKAIRLAIGMGGDTDTIAAMTGALCGARCAEQAVPSTWLHRLDVGPRLWTAATGLADLQASHR